MEILIRTGECEVIVERGACFHPSIGTTTLDLCLYKILFIVDLLSIGQENKSGPSIVDLLSIGQEWT
jgi:hypothetical protein